MLGINNINYLSQRDIRWGKNKIGNSQVDLAHYGCTTTCVSMASDWFGEYKSPLEISNHKELYTSDGSLIWINLKKLFKTFDFRWREGNILINSNTRNDELIRAYLSGGAREKDGVVLLAVANNSHWLLPIWYDDLRKDYKCIDPWFGRDCFALESYGNISTSVHLLKNGVAKNKLQPLAPNYN